MISPDDIVLGCYQLAYFYHVDPRVFLEQTVSELNRHKFWTDKLNERIRAQQEADAPSEG
jgi:hypothetical protein